MIYNIYSVFDSKASAYMQPFFHISRGSALRAFIDTAQDSSSVIGKHPEDYNLFEFGFFDDLSGEFNLSIPPVSLGCAIELLSKK